MDFDKALGRLALALPVLHVVACSLFLVGYSAGFGSGVGTLFAVSDFFTISVDHLVRMYAFGLGIPLVAIIYRHKSGFAYAVDRIAAEPDDGKRGELVRSHARIRALLTIALITSATFAIFDLFVAAHYDLYRMYYFNVSLITVALAIPFWKFCDKIGFYGLWVEIAYLILCFVPAVISIGMDEGLQDRRLPISRYESTAYTCNGHKIVGSVGERFISASGDGKRHVINEKCEVLFDFPETPLLRREATFPAIIESIKAWWNS